MFVRLGFVVAWGAVILGSLRITMGFIGALYYEPSAEFAKRYLSTATTGDAIDQGLQTFVIGICIGLLATVARAKTTS